MRSLAAVRATARAAARRAPRASRAYGSLPARGTFHTDGATPTTDTNKPPRYGQPLAGTHAHLVHARELTPGITAGEYEERRRRLMDSLPAGAVVVCMGSTVRLVSQRECAPDTPATDFYYLTGFDEPDATLVLVSRPSTPRGYTMTMFVPPRERHELLWAGERTGVEGAVEIFGADEAFPSHELPGMLPGFLHGPDVYASLPPSPSPSASSQPFTPPPPRRRSSLLKLFSPEKAGSSFADGDPPHLVLAAALASEHAKPLERPIQALRVRKSPAELRLMKAAAEMSSRAHREVMRFAKPGGTEAQLAAHFEYTCALGGSERPAYVPVVASGANSLVIHYTRNDCELGENDMVLIDAGGERHMYASDITRTFPVSGKFTDPQRDLYQAVLNVQKECVKRVRLDEGVSLNELHRASCTLLNTELKNIGFRLSVGDVERKLYPHFLSHHVGSDLHDCPTADRSAVLREGNVITIEPGVYVPFDAAFPKAFHGLGVRIEDEVACTRDGPAVLSTSAPKEVRDVEAACQA
ncbi:hypothetical protein VHUM_02802 [Vanrija humicola]|uniref:Aminopeptidase P N-terminal domain-containing protein n=1 Tax=Vanrija humicola TaxID=5417 RepID=A0A7D8UY24_VANHU|nr:hypothetical protein VHUM_02802 [Vanrija humicola]